MTDLSPTRNFIDCFPNRETRFQTSERRTINRANTMVDQIAERHGFALPPASTRPSAQETRDRIELLRRTIPNLTNAENAALSRMDLRLHEMTNPTSGLLSASASGTFTGGGLGSIGASWDGAGSIDTADRLGELLRTQNGGVAAGFAQSFLGEPTLGE